LRRVVTAKRDGEKQIIIIDSSVSVPVKVRKVFNHFNATLLKHTQIKIASDKLQLATETECMVAANHCQSVIDLKTSLLSSLRYTERCTVLNAGKRKLRARCDWIDVIDKMAVVKDQTVDARRT